MSNAYRLPAALAYVPVIGWLYVYLFQRNNSLAMFHLRQCVGLFLFLAAALAIWAAIAWILALIPSMAVIGIALFTLVMAVYLYGFVAWIMGILNALRDKSDPLPWFGRWASRLPIA
jgi:uncharacterized membrane protein